MIFKIDKTSDLLALEPKKPCSKAFKKAGVKGWYVEFKSLRELLELIAGENDSIILKTSIAEGEYSIEIYDDYRE